VNWNVGYKVARSALATFQRVGKTGKKGEIQPATITKLKNSGYSTFAKKLELLSKRDPEGRLKGLAELEDYLQKDRLQLGDKAIWHSPDDFSRTDIPFFAGMLFKDEKELKNVLGMLGQAEPGFWEKAGAAGAELGDTLRHIVPAQVFDINQDGCYLQ